VCLSAQLSVDIEGETTLIDVFLLAEITWMVVWFRNKGLRRAVLYAGGIISAGYVAANLTRWLATAFIPPTSSAFHWIQSQISLNTQTVSALSRFVPPEPAVSGIDQLQWLALHIIQGILFAAITTAIFLAFVITGYLSEVLWDGPSTLDGEKNRISTALMGAGCGLYVCLMTCLLFINLAWFKGLPLLSGMLQHSVAVNLLAQTHWHT
jgi:hypothetical protein